jgi:hypothetical protein
MRLPCLSIGPVVGGHDLMFSGVQVWRNSKRTALFLQKPRQLTTSCVLGVCGQSRHNPS